MRELGNPREARMQFEQLLATAPISTLPRARREEFVRGAKEALRALPRSAFSRDALLPPLPPEEAPLPSGPTAPQVPHRVEKIGRNEPCPCGSGKKYKKCHGR
jgi:uncharacterized protein YecA (UPF0149 family)